MLKTLMLVCLLLGASNASVGSTTVATATHVLHVYGPGGPAPAMREAAAVFGEAHGIDVEVSAGPVDKWGEEFEKNGDIIYSGSENMMSSFLDRFPRQIDASSVNPLYLRPAAILVRPGNPLHIRGFEDLLKPGMNVLVVDGAGQVGMWEDIAGADGKINTIRALRSRVALFASNSADAMQAWEHRPALNAWIIYAIWAQVHPGVADVVRLSPRYRIYRDCGVALTHVGETRSEAQAFVNFLEGPAGRSIFAKHGWTDHAAER